MMPSPANDSTSAGRPGRALAWLALAAALIAGLWFALERSRGGGATPPGEASLEDQRARERAAARFADGDSSAALAEIAPLAERESALARDLVAHGIVLHAIGDFDAARVSFERALSADADDPAASYNMGRLLHDLGDFEGALGHLRRAHELAPGDVATRLKLGDVIENSSPAEAIAFYEGIRAEGIDHVGGLYMTALFRLQAMLRREDRTEDADRVLAEFQELQGRGLALPSSTDVDRGALGTIVPPAPPGHKQSEPGPLPSFAAAEILFPELAGATAIEIDDLDNDGEADVLARGPFGIAAGLQAAAGAYVVAADPRAAELVLAIDLAHDDDLDLVAAHGERIWVYEAELARDPGAPEGAPARLRWAAGGREIAALPTAPRAGLALDYDHDGDLDLAFVGSFGLRLLRNDAAETTGSFVDATAESALATDRPFDWLVSEDFDTDSDVDLLCGGAAGLYLASNLRGGRFEDASARLAGLEPAALPFAVADLDGDGRPDLVRAGPDGTARAWRALPSGRYEPLGEPQPFRAGAPLLLDLDLDGALDLIGAQGPGAAGVQTIGAQSAKPFDLALELPAGAELASSRAAADWDADLDLDLLSATSAGIALQRGSHGGANRALLFALRGQKDNRRGVGAVVELRSGLLYTRVYWRGKTELVGLGPECKLDWLRITWPNGVKQYDPRLDCGDRRVTTGLFDFLQEEGQVGSCPFLYTWNGSTFEFISDVLGVTPLGLPMAPGLLVPPDHDEYVLVRGEQLAPRDGFLELQLTEELREVTYLDRLRLDVVDHPADTEIYPNERFTFPPFPEPHTHTLRGALAPLSARDDQGRDWTAALSAADDTYAVPFEPAPAQYRGLATPHALELAFDAEAVRGARKLRLVLTGWLYWTDASVNVASARDPDWSFAPPELSVPDGAGGWRSCGPPIGFPAGKTKTMVIDVTELVERADPRLRLDSSLRLYWDSILLAVDDDDAELRVAPLEPVSARLWRRGFSAPEEPADPHKPERFDWERLALHPRWDAHPGLYTKLGEVLPLVAAVDDQFVVMGTGEALHVRFDARGLAPVPAGFRRDYILFLDGWAKDRDPNTVSALYVEPLPFHGMSGYPYGPGESFPDTAATRAWRRTWQTRAAEPWLESPGSASPSLPAH